MLLGANQFHLMCTHMFGLLSWLKLDFNPIKPTPPTTTPAVPPTPQAPAQTQQPTAPETPQAPQTQAQPTTTQTPQTEQPTGTQEEGEPALPPTNGNSFLTSNEQSKVK